MTIRNIDSNTHSPNNGGCHPESCTDVLIENCSFNTGDDCIAIKSGRNADDRRVNVPCANLIIRNCAMKDGHGGLSFGSEVSGGIAGVFVENGPMNSPSTQRALRIKTNSHRGGTIENVYFWNVTAGQVAEAVIKISFYYEEGERGPFRPVVHNVVVSDVTCRIGVMHPVTWRLYCCNACLRLPQVQRPRPGGSGRTPESSRVSSMPSSPLVSAVLNICVTLP